MPLSECRQWGTSDIRQRQFMTLARLKNARAPEPTVQVELPLKNYTNIIEWEFPETQLTPRMISMFIKSGAHVLEIQRDYSLGGGHGIAVPALIESTKLSQRLIQRDSCS